MTFSNVKPKAILQLGKECILENETNISETKVLESILGLWERERERERERENINTQKLIWFDLAAYVQSKKPWATTSLLYWIIYYNESIGGKYKEIKPRLIIKWPAEV